MSKTTITIDLGVGEPVSITETTFKGEIRTEVVGANKADMYKVARAVLSTWHHLLSTFPIEANTAVGDPEEVAAAIDRTRRGLHRAARPVRRNHVIATDAKY